MKLFCGYIVVSTSLAMAALGCGDARVAGHVLVNVDADVPVPQFIDRVRIDVYHEHQELSWRTWRDFNLIPDPNQADAGAYAVADAGDSSTSTRLPFSFALESNSTASALMRIRAYRAGKARPYEGECFRERVRQNVTAPEGAPCQTGEVIEARDPREPRAARQLRVADRPAAATAKWACGSKQSESDVAALKLSLEGPGTYELSLDVNAVDETNPLLFLVRNCESPQPHKVDCDDDGLINGSRRQALALQFTVSEEDLSGNSYFAVLSNAHPSAFDGTLDLTLQNPDLTTSSTLASDGGASCPNLQPELTSAPNEEPLPDLAIDRLVRIEVRPNTVASTVVTLSGNCFGMMADLYGKRSCVDSGVLVSVPNAAMVDGAQRFESSASGTWSGATPRDCVPDGNPSRGDDERVCIRGGAFVFGEASIEDVSSERIVTVSPFYLDRREFTIGDYRYLRDQGIRVSLPGCGGASNVADSEAPNLDLPLTCVPWAEARALCRAYGGDLPSTVQWEFAAAAAGRSVETIYPWGDDPVTSSMPTCSVLPATDASWDVTNNGVMGLAGNVREWTLDSYRPFSDSCWADQPMADPGCRGASSARTVKGSSWRQCLQALNHAAAAQQAVRPTDATDDIGFRCAYSPKQPQTN